MFYNVLWYGCEKLPCIIVLDKVECNDLEACDTNDTSYVHNNIFVILSLLLRPE